MSKLSDFHNLSGTCNFSLDFGGGFYPLFKSIANRGFSDDSDTF
eukprot:UN23056